MNQNQHDDSDDWDEMEHEDYSDDDPPYDPDVPDGPQRGQIAYVHNEGPDMGPPHINDYVKIINPHSQHYGLKGRVVWVNNTYCGVNLAQEMTKKEITTRFGLQKRETPDMTFFIFKSLLSSESFYHWEISVISSTQAAQGPEGSIACNPYVISL